MSSPADYPIRWERGFGWRTWRYFFHLIFPGRPRPIPGYDILPVSGTPLWRWPSVKLQRLRWAMRGPV